ncbi:hypothetical protein E2C01_020983 [Portunus trituberculatus]|uniref:Uncharacterized protein n=1 Tax=Portunus trituberculatus TaxID=210409 RepID=A0A5B7E313_PORTR|nr:hypothetical protein [Portunus trituberculatus]
MKHQHQRHPVNLGVTPSNFQLRHASLRFRFVPFSRDNESSNLRLIPTPGKHFPERSAAK